MNYPQKKKLAFMSIANRIKGFVRTVTGALPLTLTNCVDNKSIINYKLYGQCVQDGTPSINNPVEVESVGDFSKNLFDMDSCEYMHGDRKGESIISTTALNVDIYLKAGTYSLTFKCDKEAEIYLRKGQTTSGYFDTTKLTPNTVSNVLSFTYNDDDWMRITSFMGNAVFYDFMLVEGKYDADTMPEYSQYNKYKIPVIVEGKNLFDINNPVYGATSSNNFNRKPKIENGVIRFYTWYTMAGGAGFMVPVPPNAEFTVSFDVIEGEFVSEILSSNNGIDDEGIITDFVRLTPLYTNVNKITYTQPSDKHYICILLNCLGGYFKCAIRNLQVELGSIATEYEPYHEPTTTNIYLDEPLRKVGDYADYIDHIRKKVVRNIFHCSLLDIVGDVTSGNQYTNGLCRVQGYVKPSANMLIAPLSRSMKGGTKINSESVGLYFENQYKILYCYFNSNDVGLTEGMSSSEIANAIKQYIQDNEIDIYYVLKTPIEEAIELPKIPTHKGTSIISADTSVQPSNAEITYYSSLKE